MIYLSFYMFWKKWLNGTTKIHKQSLFSAVVQIPIEQILSAFEGTKVMLISRLAYKNTSSLHNNLS